MNALRAILCEVNNGRTSFRPAGSGRDDLVVFQETVTAIRTAVRQGYLKDCVFHRGSRSGVGLFDLVSKVSLTRAGQRLLENPGSGALRLGAAEAGGTGRLSSSRPRMPA